MPLDPVEPKPLGGRAWRRIVAFVVKRDRGICHLCGEDGADSADHVILRSQGGSDHPDNLLAAHLLCNQRRGTLSVEEARRRLRIVHPTDWRW